ASAPCRGGLDDQSRRLLASDCRDRQSSDRHPWHLQIDCRGNIRCMHKRQSSVSGRAVRRPAAIDENIAVYANRDKFERTLSLMANPPLQAALLLPSRVTALRRLK